MALSLVLLFMPDRYREGLAEGLQATVLRPVVALQRSSADREGRYADASRLRAERDSLAAFLVGQATLAAENRQLRSLLGFRTRLAYSFVPAEAARGRGVGSGGTLQLTVGRRDGVQETAALVTADGLAGRIWRLAEASSVGIDWTHPEFRVSVMTTDGETYGIAEPADGPNGERMLSLSPVAFHTVPDSGSLIVTSGDGGLYPRGIPVGRVAGSGKEPTGWQRVYYIRPLVSPPQMSHVLVLGEPVPARTDQDLAAAWGVRLVDSPRADSARQAVSPDASTPAPARRPAPRPAPQRRLPERRVDPTPELPGRPVFPNQPRVPEGLPAPTRPQNPREER